MSFRCFVNLVTLNRERFIYSLRRMDMSRQHLFYPTTPAEQKKINFQEMEIIEVPPPSFNFLPNPSPFNGTWKMHCFGLSEVKMIFTDRSGLSFLYDASLDSILVLPSLHTNKRGPIYFSVPDSSEQDRGGGSRLYTMEQSLRPGRDKLLRPCPDIGQFEALFYAKPNRLCCEKVWLRHLLPLPPFALEPGFQHTWICSYAVLGGGPHLCMSFRGFGTYCFDTARKEWSHAGNWLLPIYGKAEYLPELNLWFGFKDDLLLGFSDLSSALTGEKPELCGVLGNDYFPPDWELVGVPQIFNMGSGRLCIFGTFHSTHEASDMVLNEVHAVFTGVEVLAAGSGSGKGKVLQMINHKSGIYRPEDSTATIEAVL